MGSIYLNEILDGYWHNDGTEWVYMYSIPLKIWLLQLQILFHHYYWVPESSISFQSSNVNV